MNHSILRATLADVIAIACALAVFFGVAFDTPVLARSTDSALIVAPPPTLSR